MDNKKTTIYIAGKITGASGYKLKFFNAQERLQSQGYIALSPAWLPSEGFTYEQYMDISGAMLDACEAVLLLKDWRESKGATHEAGRALAMGKIILEEQGEEYVEVIQYATRIKD